MAIGAIPFAIRTGGLSLGIDRSSGLGQTESLSERFRHLQEERLARSRWSSRPKGILHTPLMPFPSSMPPGGVGMRVRQLSAEVNSHHAMPTVNYAMTGRRTSSL